MQKEILENKWPLRWKKIKIIIIILYLLAMTWKISSSHKNIEHIIESLNSVLIMLVNFYLILITKNNVQPLH